MKAVLVIDMPNNCEECKIIHLQGHGESICDSGDWSKRPDWCPLKPLPQTIAYEMTDTQTTKAVELIDNAFKLGWNTCLNVITGETE